MEIIVTPAMFDEGDWTPELENELNSVFEGMISLDEIDSFSAWLNTLPCGEGN